MWVMHACHNSYVFLASPAFKLEEKFSYKTKSRDGGRGVGSQVTVKKLDVLRNDV
jgi:hypothetical protein